ncbi:MAG: replication-associated recombination protein A [Eubacteriales bacterium]|nr:replication-associated recombination protein A [Eubacteriales bacterium]
MQFNEVRDHAPLAYRMAPQTLAEIVGQSEILAPGKLLRRMIENDRLSSVILFGPPGTGKTTIARVIARSTESRFRAINAVTSGVKELRELIAETENPFQTPEGRCLLFVDEIHRFNKAQQDLLLPYVERGLFILIGATTENPYFEVNKALISRSTVFQLKPLEVADLKLLLERAIKDPERGLGQYKIKYSEDALELLANLAAGDARVALNNLELAVLASPGYAAEAENAAPIELNRELIEGLVQHLSPRYDKDGEEHYNTISALIKSCRGSDPDASIFYLAKALAAGETPEFLSRRLIILAAEDIGMANPQALSLAVACDRAVRTLGMPEARIILAECVVMLATSPKSNSAYRAIDRALDLVRSQDCGEIPLHLRNAPVKAMAEDLGYSVGYKYAHNYPGNIVRQQYLPDKIKDQIFYHPSSNGYEARVAEWLENLRATKAEDSKIE